MTDDKGWQHLPKTIVPFGWAEFFNKYKIIYNDYGLSLSAKQALFHLSLYTIGQTGWALDQLLYSKWPKTPLKSPVFILGMQRSGTTFLHRLLVQDKTSARSLELHEMLLPALSIQNGLSKLTGIDKKFGGKLASWFNNFQEKKYGQMDHIHRLRFNETEEDEFVLWSIFASDMCVNDSPISIGNKKLDSLRYFEKWSQARQTKSFSWYRACLLKKFYRDSRKHGDITPWYVGKNPRFTQKIPQLLKVFPDAKLIYLVRNPLEAIPSRISMIREIWRKRFEGFDQMTSKQVNALYKDCLRAYLKAERDLPMVPDNQKLIVPYPELREDPVKVIREIYKRFSLPGPDHNLEKELSKLENSKKPYKSKHKYKLDEFKLNEQKIRENLADIFTTYNFE